MSKITMHPGDIAVIGGIEFTVDRTVTLRSSAEIQRMPTPDLTDLPETDLRVRDLWQRQGQRRFS